MALRTLNYPGKEFYDHIKANFHKSLNDLHSTSGNRKLSALKKGKEDIIQRPPVRFTDEELIDYDDKLIDGEGDLDQNEPERVSLLDRKVLRPELLNKKKRDGKSRTNVEMSDGKNIPAEVNQVLDAQLSVKDENEDSELPFIFDFDNKNEEGSMYKFENFDSDSSEGDYSDRDSVSDLEKALKESDLHALRLKGGSLGTIREDDQDTVSDRESDYFSEDDEDSKRSNPLKLENLHKIENDLNQGKQEENEKGAETDMSKLQFESSLMGHRVNDIDYSELPQDQWAEVDKPVSKGKKKGVSFDDDVVVAHINSEQDLAQAMEEFKDGNRPVYLAENSDVDDEEERLPKVRFKLPAEADKQHDIEVLGETVFEPDPQVLLMRPLALLSACAKIQVECERDFYPYHDLSKADLDKYKRNLQMSVGGANALEKFNKKQENLQAKCRPCNQVRREITLHTAPFTTIAIEGARSTRGQATSLDTFYTLGAFLKIATDNKEAVIGSEWGEYADAIFDEAAGASMNVVNAHANPKEGTDDPDYEGQVVNGYVVTPTIGRGGQMGAELEARMTNDNSKMLLRAAVCIIGVGLGVGFAGTGAGVPALALVGSVCTRFLGSLAKKVLTYFERRQYHVSDPAKFADEARWTIGWVDDVAKALVHLQEMAAQGLMKKTLLSKLPAISQSTLSALEQARCSAHAINEAADQIFVENSEDTKARKDAEDEILNQMREMRRRLDESVSIEQLNVMLWNTAKLGGMEGNAGPDRRQSVMSTQKNLYRRQSKVNVVMGSKDASNYRQEGELLAPVNGKLPGGGHVPGGYRMSTNGDALRKDVLKKFV